MWIVEHFRILPTDKRFKQLSLDQMELLYYSFLNMPLDDALRKYYYDNKEKEDTIKSLPEEQLHRMGYSKDDIEKLKGELKHG